MNKKKRGEILIMLDGSQQEFAVQFISTFFNFYIIYYYTLTSARKGVIDIALCNSSLRSFIQGWRVYDEDSLSDHRYLTCWMSTPSSDSEWPSSTTLRRHCKRRSPPCALSPTLREPSTTPRRNPSLPNTRL